MSRITDGPRQVKKKHSNMCRNVRVTSSCTYYCTCAKSHPGICSPLKHSVVSNDLFANSEGPDQTERMRSLIWAFAVRIYPKTCFGMARPRCGVIITMEKGVS